MCGFVARLFEMGFDEAAERQTVDSMLSALSYRGPDDKGIELVQPIAAIGHVRLSIIDPELGRQPMFSEDGRFLLVFNGAIYNYVELRAELVSFGHRFRTESDTEVLLRHLMQFGPDRLGELRGMFSFLFLDTVTRRWILARDHFGIKPLYYAEQRDCFSVASEVKALLRIQASSVRVDSHGLSDYTLFQFPLGTRTMFSGVSQLRPGSYVLGRGGSVVKSQVYWVPSYSIRHRSEEELIDETRHQLNESVRLQLRSDVPVGAYLSGGLDSSTVALLAATQLPGGLKVFHGKFARGRAFDESSYAKQVAQLAGAEMYEVSLGVSDFIDSLSSITRHMDYPVAGPGVFPQYFVSRLAAEHVKVVLGGQGGDEIFGGYVRYFIAYLEQALKGAIYESDENEDFVIKLTDLIPQLPLIKSYRPLLQQFWNSGLFESMDRRYLKLITRSSDLLPLFGDNYAAEINLGSSMEHAVEIFNSCQSPSYINKMLNFDVATLLPSLLHVEDRVSMAHSIESRVPLLDPNLVGLVASAPPKLKFGAGVTKNILKKTVRGLVPDQIIDRADKMGFPVPLVEWFAESSEFRDCVFDLVSSPKILNKEAVRKVLQNETIENRVLWAIISLESWAQEFNASP